MVERARFLVAGLRSFRVRLRAGPARVAEELAGVGVVGSARLVQENRGALGVLRDAGPALQHEGQVEAARRGALRTGVAEQFFGELRIGLHALAAQHGAPALDAE